MILSTTTSILSRRVGDKNAIEIIKKAGFDAYDISLVSMRDDDHYLNGEDYIEKAHSIKNFADSLGLPCNQAHAPFPSSVGDEEKDAKIFKKIVRSMEIASILGAKIIIVHPKHHLPYQEHIEELYNMNVEFYNSLIPYCKKYNIKVACENMWQCNSNTYSIIDSTCSRPWEFNKYIDALNSEWIVGCLDIGHTSLVGTDTSDFIHSMGNKRLQALHVHDTDFVNDLHTLPFFGKIDYEKVVRALGEIDYQGDFTFEAECVFDKIPINALQPAADLMCSIGRYLTEKIETYKNN